MCVPGRVGLVRRRRDGELEERTSAARPVVRVADLVAIVAVLTGRVGFRDVDVALQPVVLGLWVPAGQSGPAPGRSDERDARYPVVLFAAEGLDLIRRDPYGKQSGERHPAAHRVPDRYPGPPGAFCAAPREQRR
jgi:hypothetical protein